MYILHKLLLNDCVFCLLRLSRFLFFYFFLTIIRVFLCEMMKDCCDMPYIGDLHRLRYFSYSCFMPSASIDHPTLKDKTRSKNITRENNTYFS